MLGHDVGNRLFRAVRPDPRPPAKHGSYRGCYGRARYANRWTIPFNGDCHRHPTGSWDAGC